MSSSTERRLLIAADTNILTSSSLLRSTAGLALLELIGRANGSVLLPEVIELEITNVLARKLMDDADRAVRQVSGLQNLVQKPLFSLPKKDVVQAAIDEALKVIEPILHRERFTIEIARAALMRVIEKRAPTGSNNEQFRDCCIWEHCIELGKHHEVYLITADGNFYQDRKPENGLEHGLRNELDAAHSRVNLHPNITTVVDKLAPSIPSHDEEAIGRSIGEAAIKLVKPLAEHAGFSLGHLTQAQVRFKQTGMPLSQLVIFDLNYSLNENADREVPRFDPELLVRGNCTLGIPNNVIQSDIRIDEHTISWKTETGQTVSRRTHHLYVEMSGGMSAGTSPYNF